MTNLALCSGREPPAHLMMGDLHLQNAYVRGMWLLPGLLLLSGD